MKNARIASLMFGTMLLAACTASSAPNDTASRALNEMRQWLGRSRRRLTPEMRKSPRSNSTMPNATRSLHEFVPHSAMTWTRPRPEPTNLNLNSVSVIKIRRRLECLRRQGSAGKPVVRCRMSTFRKGQELAALKGTSGELAALRGQLSAKDQELAGLKGNAGDRDRLSSELAQAKQRIAELERQLDTKDQELAALKGTAGDVEKLVADLAAAKQRASDLESELTRRDQEMAGLKGALDQQKTSLAEAKDDLSKLLQTEVAKGHVTMKQLGDQLTLCLATTLVFASGEAILKPGGMDVLHRIGGVLKQYPDRSIHVTGHTDSVPLKGRLAKKFPTNAELSQARAESARQALTDGGMTAERIDAKGHADSRPIASNSTVVGRQKNRRVEIVVGQ